MNLFKKRQPQNLAEWLEIATKRLAAPAKERIRTEIEAHHAEAVEEHLARGLSESAAQVAALVELGDARVVGRHFRKRHLTEREAVWLEAMLKAARSVFMLVMGYLMFASFYEVSHRAPAPQRLALIFLDFVILVILPTISFALARCNRNNRNTRLVFLLQCFGGFWMGLGIFCLHDLGRDGSQFWMDGFWFHMFLAFPNFVFSLWPLSFWKKLRTHTSEAYLPEGGATSHTS